jgi:hypothetical protein
MLGGRRCGAVPDAPTDPPYRPALEALQERQVPSTLTVTSPLDSGSGSLRAAVSQANFDAAHGQSDTITFAERLNGQSPRSRAEGDTCSYWNKVRHHGSGSCCHKAIGNPDNASACRSSAR